MCEDSLLERVIAAAEERQLLTDSSLRPHIALSCSRFYPDVSFEEALRPEALAAARQIVNLCGFFPTEYPQQIAALTASFDGPALATKNQCSARIPTGTEYRGSPDRGTSEANIVSAVDRLVSFPGVAQKGSTCLAKSSTSNRPVGYSLAPGYWSIGALGYWGEECLLYG